MSIKGYTALDLIDSRVTLRHMSDFGNKSKGPGDLASLGIRRGKSYIGRGLNRKEVGWKYAGLDARGDVRPAHIDQRTACRDPDES